MQIKINVYKHLNQEQRVEIYSFLREGLSYREIGRRLNISHTTISREVKRNSIDRGWGIYQYKPIEAEKRYKERRNKANFKHIKLWRNDKLRKKIEEILMSKTKRGPDEILGRLKLEGFEIVSTTTLYRFIRQYKPILQRGLRYKNKGYRTNKKGNKRKKMYQDVPNINDRPEIINERGRIGDFEGDTVLSGKKYKGGLATLVDRMSRYYLLKKVGNLKSDTLNMTINAMLEGKIVESVTFDNGVEFSDISQLKRPCFRADPYSSYQRGTNEKHNGFLRRFIPKGENINNRTDQEIQDIQDTINHKPRKILGYKTPYEVYHNINLTYIK